jgi:uncharacterized protein YecE (DUF72 family)
MLHNDIPQLSSAAIFLGVAGWNIRREHAHRFEADGTHLQRYATLFNAVEINSCFYRPHRFSTYERWAASVPESFRFAVKLPRAITHAARLVGASAELDRFIHETSGLGGKRGPVLVQIPPSFAFDAGVARDFFTDLRSRFEGDVAFEPRHESWFSAAAEQILTDHGIARVAADPARVPQAAEPGGSPELVYYRLHGSPRIYYSAYPPETLDRIASRLEEAAASGARTWCIFDNTALGAATADAHTVKLRLTGKPGIVC